MSWGRKKPMNPGKGFVNRGGFKPRMRETVALADEVGEGVVLPFGKQKQVGARCVSVEVGEGVVLPFDKRKQARGAAFQDEVGEGIVRGFSKRSRAIEADYKADRQRKTPTLGDPSRFKWGEEVGEGVVALPKSEAKRNQALLDMARARPCLLQAPYTMSHDPATTVACHGNSHKFGKAKGRKANDQYTVWGCFECHGWLDQGSATAEEKEKVFHLGMFRQMLAWEQVAASESEPQRFRRAAEWALDQLQADEYDPRTAILELDVAGVLELDAQTGVYLPVRNV